MDLFGNAMDETLNLLPKDGTVNYYGIWLPKLRADHYLGVLTNTITWKNDEAILFGKHFVTKRKVAWYGDDHYAYTYSNTTKEALIWTKELLEIRDRICEKTGLAFNSCLLNLYHNGHEGMAWHSDDERSMAPNGAIASLSLGAERKFSFRHKRSKETVSLTLQHGSLLLMQGQTQEHWLHSLPKTTKIVAPRINLTFRNMIG